MMMRLIDRLGDWNPQLFREVKGRLKPRNLWLAVAISVIGQLLLFLSFESVLPTSKEDYDPLRGFSNRYCLGSPPPGWEGYQQSGHYIPNDYCLQDFHGQWILNWQLWWLDLFFAISVIGIFILLVAGVYLLIADLSKEENKGTLNFIRLSPQSAKDIFWGKILGVPILIYLVGMLALPLHLLAGLNAYIPLGLILGFYSVLIASGAFFYSLALLFGLISSKLGGFQAFLGSGSVLFFFFVMTAITGERIVTHTPFDWVILFYPGTVLSYLVHATSLPLEKLNFRMDSHLQDLIWYGQSLWKIAWVGIGLIILHYGLWTYWIGQGLKRRFRNANATLLNKQTSYWISGSFAIVAVGFILQSADTHELKQNWKIFQVFLVFFALLLTTILSPHRQILQDWARYRHQTQQNHRSLLKDLILGEKSLAIVAIAFNLGIILLYSIPVLVLSPLNVMEQLDIFCGLLLSVNMSLIYAAIAQRLLLLKTPKRSVIAALAVAILMILPLISLRILGLSPSTGAIGWFFTFVPIFAVSQLPLSIGAAAGAFLVVLGHWTIFALINVEMAKQLQKMGQSQTKALLSS